MPGSLFRGVDPLLRFHQISIGQIVSRCRSEERRGRSVGFEQFD
jgi:hypothetical protein